MPCRRSVPMPSRRLSRAQRQMDVPTIAQIKMILERMRAILVREASALAVLGGSQKLAAEYVGGHKKVSFLQNDESGYRAEPSLRFCIRRALSCSASRRCAPKKTVRTPKLTTRIARKNSAAPPTPRDVLPRDDCLFSVFRQRFNAAGENRAN